MECVVTNFFTENTSLAITLIIIAVIIELIFKGIALWLSAKRKQPIWFVTLLVINSVAILPIIYLLVNRGREFEE